MLPRTRIGRKPKRPEARLRALLFKGTTRGRVLPLDGRFNKVENGIKKKFPTPEPIAAFQNADGKNSFIQVPRFWVDSLMKPQAYFADSNGKKLKDAATIPNSFWKFTLVLWRHITDGNVSREATLALSRFHVRRDAASRWTAAYAVSGLFDVTIGSPTPSHDDITRFEYLTNADETDWTCFTTALTLALDEWQRLCSAKKIGTWSNTGAFKVVLALHVGRTAAEKWPPSRERFAPEPRCHWERKRPKETSRRHQGR